MNEEHISRIRFLSIIAVVISVACLVIGVFLTDTIISQQDTIIDQFYTISELNNSVNDLQSYLVTVVDGYNMIVELYNEQHNTILPYMEFFEESDEIDWIEGLIST